MRTTATSIGVLGCALLFLALGFFSIGRNLLADKAESPTPTPYLTEFDFVPLVLALKMGPTVTATTPPPTMTPYFTLTPQGTPTASTTPDPAATSTPTATGPSPTAQATVPGATATITATPTATQQPDILPTPVVNPLRVLDNHTLWIDDFGQLNVRGEVENTGSEPLRAVRVEAQFQNSKGRVVHSEDALTLMNHLAPGEKTCFALTIDPPSKWKTYSIGEVNYQIDQEPVEGLQTFGVSNGLDDLLGWYVVSGQLTNNSDNHYDLVRLVGTIYDSDGFVLGCDFAYTYNTELAQNQTDQFEVLFADRDYANAADFHIQAEGEIR